MDPINCGVQNRRRKDEVREGGGRDGSRDGRAGNFGFGKFLGGADDDDDNCGTDGPYPIRPVDYLQGVRGVVV